MARSIVGQQLSAKAASTILDRLLLVSKELTPNSLDEVEPNKLFLCGVSKSKVSYLKGLSRALLTGRLVLTHLEMLDNEEVITQLTKVNGIGQWTAEMFLIFSLGRKDVFSQGDAGLRRAMKWLYGPEIPPSQLLNLTEKWKPLRTVASLYLWEAINTGLIATATL